MKAKMTIKRQRAPKPASFEGSPADMRQDAAQAKKRGLSPAQWEASPTDAALDAAGSSQQRFAGGGAVRGMGCASRGKSFSFR